MNFNNILGFRLSKLYVFWLAAIIFRKLLLLTTVPRLQYLGKVDSCQVSIITTLLRVPDLNAFELSKQNNVGNPDRIKIAFY